MSSSVVQTNRAVCAVLEISTLSQLTPWRSQPFAVFAEVVAGRADQRDVAAQHADGEGDVARHAAAMNHQVVDQEAERNLLQMIGQQVLGEPAGKPHQIVGRNRTGHRDRHEISTLRSLRLSSLPTDIAPRRRRIHGPGQVLR